MKWRAFACFDSEGELITDGSFKDAMILHFTHNFTNWDDLFEVEHCEDGRVWVKVEVDDEELSL